MRGFRASSANHFQFALLAILLVVFNLEYSLANDADFPLISLTGNIRFTIPAILLALKVDRQLLAELARTSESKERTEAIARSIQSGYVQCGNIDAKVLGDYSATNNTYDIRIEEGVAIEKKGIEVTGVEPDFWDRLCLDLKKQFRKQSEQWIPSIDGQSLRVREFGKEDFVGKESDIPGLGNNHYINPAHLHEIETYARDVFSRNGFPHAIFSIEERIDRSEQKQTLVFRVSDLGKLVVAIHARMDKERIAAGQPVA